MSWNKRNLLAVVSLVLIIGTLASQNYGFHPITGAEAVGYNAWSLFVYVGGSWLVYKALSKGKEA